MTNTGPSTIHGDLGVSPGTAVTGFPPGLIVPAGTLHAADAVALNAKNDVVIAYNSLASQAVTQTLTSQNLGGKTLVAGVYFYASSAQLTGTLKLDGQGNPDAVFIFQIGSTLTTASNANVKLLNGAQPCNVFWQVGSSATLGTNTSFIGNILALTSISLTTGASVNGRALARNGAVTLDTNHIHFSSCATGGSGGGDIGDIPGSGPGDGGTPYMPPVAVPGPICVDVKGPKPGETVLVTGTPTRTYLTIQDAGSGLASIVVVETTNAAVSIPVFAPGTKEVVIMSTKLGPGLSGFDVKAIDVCGNVSIIDPVDFVIVANQTVTLTGLPKEEHFVTIKNEGLQALIITVNGDDARTVRLAPTTTRTVNIRKSIERGKENSIIFEAVGYGTEGRAVVLVHPRSE